MTDNNNQPPLFDLTPYGHDWEYKEGEDRQMIQIAEASIKAFVTMSPDEQRERYFRGEQGWRYLDQDFRSAERMCHEIHPTEIAFERVREEIYPKYNEYCNRLES